MTTITINSVDYDVYADVDMADEYMAGAFHGQAWLELDTALKQQALVTSTRILDRQKWKGEKTAASQVLQFPRTGTGVTGTVDNVIPQTIINASIELAYILTGDNDVQDSQNTAQKIQQLSAGSVSLTFFREAEGAPLRFPLIVHELIVDYLSGRGNAMAGFVSGVDGESVTNQIFTFTRGL